MHALTPYVTGGVHQHSDFGPAVSPDGRWIAFTRFDDEGIAAQVYVMDADGHQPRAITPPRLEGGHASWAPDSSEIVFESNEVGAGSRIFTVRPDGSGLRALTRDRYPHNDVGASYSANGARIAFSSDRRYRDGCCLDLFEMRPDGSGEHRINVGLQKAGIVGAVWSPVPRARSKISTPPPQMSPQAPPGIGTYKQTEPDFYRSSPGHDLKGCLDA
jgi:Tol biopolymer transport system component